MNRNFQKIYANFYATWTLLSVLQAPFDAQENIHYSDPGRALFLSDYCIMFYRCTSEVMQQQITVETSKVIGIYIMVEEFFQRQKMLQKTRRALTQCTPPPQQKCWEKWWIVWRTFPRWDVSGLAWAGLGWLGQAGKKSLHWKWKPFKIWWNVSFILLCSQYICFNKHTVN